MSLLTGLLAFYKLDGDVTDFTGNGHNGTVSNGPLTYGAGVNGQAATGTIATPATDSPRVALAGFSPLPTAWSVGARVKLTAYTTLNSAGCTIVGSDANSRAVVINDAGWVGYSLGGSGVRSGFPAPPVVAVPIGTWTHVGVTYDGTTLRNYINGVQVGFEAIGDLAGYIATFNPKYLLSQTAGFWAAPLDGLIDDIAIYDRTLSALEMAELDTDGPFELPPPVLTGIDPESGVQAGGTEVTLTGTDFVDGATVTFGGVAASVEFVDDTELIATTPAGAVGVVDVVVTNPDDAQDTLAGAFEYVTAASLEAAPVFTKYGSHLVKLLPPGVLWDFEGTSELRKTLVAMGDEFQRVEDRGVDLIEESDPRTATETIGDWEEMVSLPDEQVTEISADIAERRIAVTQKLVGRSGQDDDFYERLCAACGFSLISITRHANDMTRSGTAESGDTLSGVAWAYAITLRVLETLNALTEEQFEAVVRAATHSHITVVFIYT